MKISHILPILVIGFIAMSCADKNQQKKEDEIATLNQYLLKAGIPDSMLSDSGKYYATHRPSGLIYIERKLGKGIAVSLNSTAYYRYEVYFLDSTLLVTNTKSVEPTSIAFDSNSSSPSFPGDMKGVQEAVSMMRDGGKATIIFTSTLGYGKNGGYGIGGYVPIRIELSVTAIE